MTLTFMQNQTDRDLVGVESVEISLDVSSLVCASNLVCACILASS